MKIGGDLISSALWTLESGCQNSSMEASNPIWRNRLAEINLGTIQLSNLRKKSLCTFFLCCPKCHLRHCCPLANVIHVRCCPLPVMFQWLPSPAREAGAEGNCCKWLFELYLLTCHWPKQMWTTGQVRVEDVKSVFQGLWLQGGGKYESARVTCHEFCSHEEKFIPTQYPLPWNSRICSQLLPELCFSLQHSDWLTPISSQGEMESAYQDRVIQQHKSKSKQSQTHSCFITRVKQMPGLCENAKENSRTSTSHSSAFRLNGNSLSSSPLTG